MSVNNTSVSEENTKQEDREQRPVQKGNMTSGNPVKAMILFALPMIVGNLFQQFYNLVDSLLVGKLIDSSALSAVGASTSIVMLFVMVAAGTGIGFSVVISQLFGAKKIKEMKTAISTAIITVLVFAIILSVIGRLFSTDILRWLDTPDEVFVSAEIYLNIYFYGFTFLFLYNVFNAIFNALGQSKIPLVFLIGSSILNVILDIIMIRQMGIAGAAWATLISQAVSAVLSFIVLVKRLAKMESASYSRFDKNLMNQMIKVAIPSIIQQSMVSIGMLFIQKAVNMQGADFLAGYTAAVKIDGIAIVPLVNVGNAVSTFVAQNMGAKKVDRAKQGYHIGSAMGVGMGLLITLIFWIWGDTFVAGFMDAKEDATAIALGAKYLGTVSLFYFLFALMNCTGAVLRGAADMKWFLIQSLVNLASRIIITYAFLDVTGGNIIMWAMPISWTIGLCVSFGRYKSGKWSLKTLA